MAPSNIQFVYFNAKGRGEKVRWVLVQSGAKWEDKRMVEGEWATLKPKTFSGTLPYIVVDGGVEIPTSNACAAYIAKQFGLLGSNDVDEAYIRMVVDNIQDTMIAKVKASGSKDETQQAELWKAYEESAFPKLVALINKMLSGGKQWLVGDKVSLADLYLVEFLSERNRPDILRQIKADAATSGIIERVMNLPKIKEWVKNRPQTKF